jgi:hypothetical protein
VLLCRQQGTAVSSHANQPNQPNNPREARPREPTRKRSAGATTGRTELGFKKGYRTAIPKETDRIDVSFPF